MMMTDTSSPETHNSGVLAKVCLIFMGSLCWLQPTNADEPAKREPIKVFISPECKDMFYGPDFVDMDAHGKAIKKRKRQKPDYAPWDPARAKPLSYKDPGTSITFNVESDGRHLAAMDSQGKLLWVRNPWEDAHTFCPYQTPRPVVASLKAIGGNPEHRFIAIKFDSSQFGVLDESTGDFFPGGQN